MNARIWFTTTQAAAYANRHVITLRKALEAGELHGTQRTKGGRWSVHYDCLTAYIEAAECPRHDKAGAA